jgi:hypothetical protein
MRHNTIAAIAMFVAGSFAAEAQAQSQPFSETICGVRMSGEIKAPPAGANPALARYLGVWTGGRWNPDQCNGFIVTEVTAAGTATVRYIFPPTQDVPLGWFEKTDAVLDQNGRLNFKSLLGNDVLFQIQPDGTLNGWFTPKNGFNNSALVGHTRKVAPPR